MRLPVAPATAPARLWLAAVASAAVIGGAYLLESHGHSWAAAGLVAAGVAARAPPLPPLGPPPTPPAPGAGDRGAAPPAAPAGVVPATLDHQAPPLPRVEV